MTCISLLVEGYPLNPEFILHFLCFKADIFPENDLASSAVRCAPSAVVCIHRLHALYKPYIYISIYVYIIYLSVSFILYVQR